MKNLPTRRRIWAPLVIWTIVSVWPMSRGDCDDPKLSPEGLIRRDAHEFLVGPFIADRQVTIRGEGATRILDEVVVASDRRMVSDGDVMDLPDSAQRVAGMFRYLVMKGSGLDKIRHIRILPFAADSHPHQSKQVPDYYRVQMPSLPLPTRELPAMKIQFELAAGDTATVEEVLFNSQGRLPMTFDDIPYRNLGAELPRQPVAIEVATSHELSVEGHVDLERQKWFRYYASPGTVHSSFEQWAAERNFLPGRQILKLEPALVRGYSPNQPKLTELASQPGKPDLRFFERYSAGGSLCNAIPAFRDIRYAMCFDEWPAFMSRSPGGRGTPNIEAFDDAAELAAALVADEIDDAGRTATWWEVKNESTIKAEWDYHYLPEHDSWALLADFHNRVADAIHAKTPSVRVGGPTSAWMQVQVNDFALYREQAAFMEATRSHLDFYSHHFYENIASLGAYERRGSGYTGYLLGRAEAILDMFRAHMHRADCVKPILITECGSLQGGRTPSDNWLRLRSYNAYLMKFMQRPEQLDLTVPFVFLQIPWAPTSGDAAFTPLEGKHPHGPMKDFEPTDVANFFELWRDFDGRRLPVRFRQPFLDVVAVHDDESVQVAVTNMGGRRLDLDLHQLADRLQSRHIAQRRLRYHDGQVVYEPAVDIANAASIPIDVEETTIIRFTIDRPLDVSGKMHQRRDYALETAVKCDEAPVEFAITRSATSPLISATLIVGVHHADGLAETPEVEINGHSISADVGWTDGMRNLFAPLEISLPNEWIQTNNQIRIQPQPGITITSVQLKTLSFD